MSVAFVLGNGESRRGLDLKLLIGNGEIWGCNALYRDFSPDHLVTVDHDMCKEISESEYIKDHHVYMRYNYVKDNPKSEMIPKDQGWSAGPTAVRLACENTDEIRALFMFGFDIYGTGPEKNRHNNIYKGTKNYRPANASATYTENWIDQLRKVFVKFPHVEFFRVGSSDQQVPKGWDGIENITNIPYGAFLAGLYGIKVENEDVMIGFLRRRGGYMGAPLDF